MGRRPSLRNRSRRTLALIAGAASLAIVAGAPSQAMADGCARASASPAEVSVAQVKDATLCLLNAERRQHGLRPFRANRQLSLAATRHSRDMVRRN